MFSFAMTSGLASDFDKFKIIITLRRAQKFGDTGPYKNFDSSSSDSDQSIQFQMFPKYYAAPGAKISFNISYLFIYLLHSYILYSVDILVLTVYCPRVF